MTILDLSFNSDASLLSCTTNQGFNVYVLTDTIELNKKRDTQGGIGIMQVLNKSNISVIVGGGDAPIRPKNFLSIWDDNKDGLDKIIFHVDLREQIKAALINKASIIAVLKKKICVLTLMGPEKGHLRYTPLETYQNDLGLCAMSQDENNPIIATLGKNKGEIAIWKPKQAEYKPIRAHVNNISAIAMNKEGTRVATASEAGTNVHIYDTETGQLMYQFRRGTSVTGAKPAKIYDICFDNTSQYVVCCSSNGTIHVYELYKNEADTKNVQSRIASIKTWIPLMSGYLGSHWSAETIYTEAKDRMICQFDSNNVLHVVSYDGKYIRVSDKAGEKFKKVEVNEIKI